MTKPSPPTGDQATFEPSFVELWDTADFSLGCVKAAAAGAYECMTSRRRFRFRYMAPAKKRAAREPSITGKIIARWLWFACLEVVAAIGNAVIDCDDCKEVEERKALLRNEDDPAPDARLDWLVVVVAETKYGDKAVVLGIAANIELLVTIRSVRTVVGSVGLVERAAESVGSMAGVEIIPGSELLLFDGIAVVAARYGDSIDVVPSLLETGNVV